MHIFWTIQFFGLIQFAAVFTEFKYLVESLWRNQIYAMFGFLAIDFLLHFFVVGCLGIISTYLCLSYKDYEWWWRSFWTGFGGCLYMFFFSIY